jgi:hypothetical protein
MTKMYSISGLLGSETMSKPWVTSGLENPLEASREDLNVFNALAY